MAACPYINNKTGYTAHMSIEDHPRLVNEIPRGSKRYQELKKLRSASERANSTIKDDLKILDKPRVMGIDRASILAQIAAIVLLLTRAFRYIVKKTVESRKQEKEESAPSNSQKPPNLPKSLRNLILME